MEYATSIDGAYTTCTAGSTDVPSGTYYVRYKADETHVAGDTTIVVVPEYTP